MKIIVNISSQFNKEHLLSRVYLPGDNIILFGFNAFYLCVMFHQISDQIVTHQFNEFWLKYGQFGKVLPLLSGQTGAQNSISKSQKMHFRVLIFKMFSGEACPRHPRWLAHSPRWFPRWFKTFTMTKSFELASPLSLIFS
jgi:hypothetical protein